MLLQNTGPRRFRVYGRFHHVPDEIVTLALAEQFEAYAGPGWYGMILLGDGRGFERGAEQWGTPPDEPRRDRMLGVLAAANRELSFSGHWAVAWNRADDTLVALFRDKDGDVQFAVDFQPWSRFKEWSVRDAMDHLAKAHETWRSVSADLDARPDQQVKLAQGQTRPH